MIELKNRLSEFKQVDLAFLPTPLHLLENLSGNLGVEIFLKREDLTGLALGGDKPRKLTFELTNALEMKCDTIVTCGSSQSNHARLTAAACARLGFSCELILSNDTHKTFQSNLLTAVLLGAKVNFVDTDDHWELESYCIQKMNELKGEGKKPYYIPISGTTPLSTLGYVDCGVEIAEQMEHQSLEFDYVIGPVGTGGIMTGIMLAFETLKLSKPKFIGISVNREKKYCVENIRKLWNDIARLLNLSLPFPGERLELFDQYIGDGYGIMNQDHFNAIQYLANREGILTDPVYSGKVFTGLLDLINNKHFNEKQKILMIHSGGVPALFAYQEEISEYFDL